MDDMMPDRLIDILACPECGGALTRVAGPGEDRPESPDGDARSIECDGCRRSYPVRGGIPVLYPGDIDLAHLAEEEKLAELMEKHVPSGREIFEDQQWEQSKKEFWSHVAGRLGGGGGRTILNAGSGIDTHFLGLGGEGNDLVAFDMMHTLLETLKTRHGSRMNVAGVVQALPFREESFDCICCIDLIHHEPDRLEDILRSFHSILKPGGLLFLEDINAWGLFQAWKSILMPRRLHGALRSLYHKARGSSHQPASYEFPTSVHKVGRLLERTGFTRVEAIPQYAYPNTRPAALALYRLLSRSKRAAKYHNFHYMLSAWK